MAWDILFPLEVIGQQKEQLFNLVSVETVRGTSPRTGSRIPTPRTSSAGTKSFSTHNEEDCDVTDFDDNRDQLRQLVAASASTLTVALDADAAVRNNLAQLQSLILELQRTC